MHSRVASSTVFCCCLLLSCWKFCVEAIFNILSGWMDIDFLPDSGVLHPQIPLWSAHWLDRIFPAADCSSSNCNRLIVNDYGLMVIETVECRGLADIICESFPSDCLLSAKCRFQCITQNSRCSVITGCQPLKLQWHFSTVFCTASRALGTVPANLHIAECSHQWPGPSANRFADDAVWSMWSWKSSVLNFVR